MQLKQAQQYMFFSFIFHFFCNKQVHIHVYKTTVSNQHFRINYIQLVMIIHQIDDIYIVCTDDITT